MTKTKTILLLFLFSITIGYSQYDWTKGELILKNGDTLRGLINLPMISKNLIVMNGKEKVKYRIDKKSKKQKYGEDQVQKIIFNISDTEIAYYEYIQISKNKKGIFKIICSGKANLYGRKVSMTSSSSTGYNGIVGTTQTYSLNEFYITRKNEETASPLITVRISYSFKKRAMEYFSDCPKVVYKLEQKIYKKESIKEVIDEYNNCK